MSNFNVPSDMQQRPIAKQAEGLGSNHFFNLLTSPQLLELVESHLPEHRERLYPPTVTLSMFLGQVMSADDSCQNAVNQANANRLLEGLPVNSAGTGGYCSARKRLPLEMVKALAQQTGMLLTSCAPKGWRWRGREIKLVDGTTVTIPDTPDNQAHYPQHGNQAEGIGFPLARLVGVISLSTGAILDAAMGPYKGKGSGEYGLFRELWNAFAEGDIMLADSYYCSYFLIAELQARGVDVLFEQHGARKTDFRQGKKLGKRDHVVFWARPVRPTWMSVEDYQRYPQEIPVREVKVRQKILVTTFMSPRKATKNELGKLYFQRWHVELDLRNIKSTLGMEMLSCKSADMCEKELWVYVLAYNLIRILMAESALRAQLLPRQLSFKHTLQMWMTWSQRKYKLDVTEHSETLFLLIAQIRVGDRPDRIEPRAVKRRPKAHPRLQAPRKDERERLIKCRRDKRHRLN